MMEDFIPYKIASLSTKITQDPILIETMKTLFEWANRQGLEGKKVFDLTLADQSDLESFINIWCKVSK